MSMAGLAQGIFIATVLVLAWGVWGLSRVRRVSQLPDMLPAGAPKVSVIVAALNEEATIEPAMRSLLALDYPNLEIVAVNDRSTDGTGAILDRMAGQDPRLRVLHIAQLPPGWLGKNHALHAAAAVASGDILLFTDADVVYERSALRRTVAYFAANELDHLTLFPDMHAQSGAAGAMVLGAAMFLLLRHPIWLLRRSKRVYFGAGAFNMVRASAYRAWGGHEPLKLEVLDDLMLGRLVKRLGLRQDALVSPGSVKVEWYADAPAMVKGLEKNGFANMDYSLAHVVASSALILFVRYFPYVGLVTTSGRTWWFCLGAIVGDLVAHAHALRLTSLHARCLLWVPLNPALMVYTMLRSTYITLRSGGITWRGTFYPLDELRRAHAQGSAQPAGEVQVTPR
ncbi:glycosyltransferase [Ramlibacter albus]|uniref:Glycosyltransferase n=1 Tax=Ramlibacter albus TaxID=2079448 RepID=A0A923M708_9BURK|nr:glycosyltransferase [Ramlibacter albus]MBC5763889.1 glycosyltransferase [Ramlibacter albus]